VRRRSAMLVLPGDSRLTEPQYIPTSLCKDMDWDREPLQVA
jgi:hypothetical protein